MRKLLSNRIEDWFCVRPCAVKKRLGNVSMNGMREGIENEQINFRTTQQEDLLFGWGAKQSFSNNYSNFAVHEVSKRKRNNNFEQIVASVRIIARRLSCGFAE